MFDEFRFDESNEHLKQLYKEDSLGKNYELDKFVSLLNAVPEHFVIGLDGRWGSGKTIFVKQAKLIIDALSKLEDDNIDVEFKEKLLKNDKFKNYGDYATVYYDAWENDNANDPIQSLVMTMVDEFHTSFDKNTCVNLAKAVLRVLKHIPATLNPVVPIVASAFDDIISLDTEDFLTEAKFIKQLKINVNEFLDKCIENNDRLILFVDELDRCRPEYAILLLERLKHYFDHKNVIFVFSLNVETLTNVLKSRYGTGFDANTYLDKFFDLRIGIPVCDKKHYLSYLGIKDQQESTLNYDLLSDTIESYNLELREVRKLVGTLKIAIKNVNKNLVWQDEKRKYFYCYLAYFLCVCRMRECEVYNKIISGSGEKEFVGRIVSVFSLKYFLVEYCSFEGEDKNIPHYEEDKLKMIYKYLFVEKSRNKIGSIDFSPRLKDDLLNIVNCFSELSGI